MLAREVFVVPAPRTHRRGYPSQVTARAATVAAHEYQAAGHQQQITPQAVQHLQQGSGHVNPTALQLSQLVNDIHSLSQAQPAIQRNVHKTAVHHASASGSLQPESLTAISNIIPTPARNSTMQSSSTSINSYAQPVKRSQHRHKNKGAELSKAIAACASLAELEVLYNSSIQGSCQWDELHIAAALSKAAKASELSQCSQPEPPAAYIPLLTRLMQEATQHADMGRYGPRQLTSLLWVCARLQLWQHDSGLNLLTSLAVQLRNQLWKQGTIHDGHQVHQRQPQQQQGLEVELPCSCTTQVLRTQKTGLQLTQLPCQCEPQAASTGNAILHLQQQSVALNLNENPTQALAGQSHQAHHTPHARQRDIPSEYSNSGVCALDISNAAWSLVRLGIALPGVNDTFVHNGTQEGMELLPSANPAEHDDERDDTATSHISAGKDDRGNGVSVNRVSLPTNVSSSLSQLWRPLLEAIPGCISSFGPQETSNTLWALAQAGATCHFSGTNQTAQSHDLLSTHPSASHASPQDTLQHATPLTSQQISHLAFQHTHVHQRVHQQPVDSAVRTLCSRLYDLADQLTDRQHIPNSVWALATMGYRDVALLDVLVDKARTPTMLRSLTAHGLSSIAWAYARLHYKHEPLFHDIVRAACWKARKFRLQGLSNLVWAVYIAPDNTRATNTLSANHNTFDSQHASVNHIHNSPGHSLAGRHLLSLVAREAVYKMEEASPLALATLTQAWAAAGFCNVSLFTAAVTRAQQLLHRFRPVTLLRLICALSRGGHVDPSFVEAAAKQVFLPWLQNQTQATSETTVDQHDHSRNDVNRQWHQHISMQQCMALALAYGNARLQSQPSCHALMIEVAKTLSHHVGCSTTGHDIPTGLVEQRLSNEQAVQLLIAYASIGFGHIHQLGTLEHTPVQQLMQHVSQLLIVRHLQRPLTAQQLVAATWASTSLGVPQATEFVQACLTSVISSQAAVTRCSCTISPHWRARLIWALCCFSHDHELHHDSNSGIQPSSHLEMKPNHISTTTMVPTKRIQQLVAGLKEDMHQLDCRGLILLSYGIAAILQQQQQQQQQQSKGTLETMNSLQQSETVSVSLIVRTWCSELERQLVDQSPWTALLRLSQVPAEMTSFVMPLILKHKAAVVAWALSGSHPIPNGRQPSALASNRSSKTRHSRTTSRPATKSNAVFYQDTSKPAIARSPERHSSGPRMSAEQQLNAVVQGWTALKDLRQLDKQTTQALATAVLRLHREQPLILRSSHRFQEVLLLISEASKRDASLLTVVQELHTTPPATHHYSNSHDTNTHQHSQSPPPFVLSEHPVGTVISQQPLPKHINGMEALSGVPQEDSLPSSRAAGSELLWLGNSTGTQKKELREKPVWSSP